MLLPPHRMSLSAPPRTALLLAAALALAGCSSSPAKTATVSAPFTAQSTATSGGDASTTPKTSAATSGSSALGAVDACTLLKPADFTAATTATAAGQYPSSVYTLKTEPTKTDVGPAVDQHSACIYHFAGKPGYSNQLTLDVMTATEYQGLSQFDKPKPVSGLGDEAGVFGDRPAFRKGDHGYLIANSQGSTAFSVALLKALATHL